MCRSAAELRRRSISFRGGGARDPHAKPRRLGAPLMRRRPRGFSRRGRILMHEIKHDGFRILARRDGSGSGVRLLTRHGNDFTHRFPLAVAAVSALPGSSLLIDGEAIVTNGDGLAVFDLIRPARHGNAVLCVFDLIELDGQDLRRSPIAQRKTKLARLMHGPHPGIVLNEHYEGDGDIVFKHACKLGCEGIVSKRLGLSFRALAGSRSKICAHRQ